MHTETQEIEAAFRGLTKGMRQRLRMLDAKAGLACEEEMRVLLSMYVSLMQYDADLNKRHDEVQMLNEMLQTN